MESADRWFKCKLIFITLDEKSGAEKKTSTQVLVQAADLRDAVKKLDEGMKGTMADYQIGMVSETPLMDVYPYRFNFITLQVSDKMPFDIFGQTFVFSCHFLHFAFSKNTLSCLIT